MRTMHVPMKPPKILIVTDECMHCLHFLKWDHKREKLGWPKCQRIMESVQSSDTPEACRLRVEFNKLGGQLDEYV
jgi:hypothetical protein